MKNKRKNIKFSTQDYPTCKECGRPRAVFTKYMLCRFHLRSYINAGLLPGFRKASW